MKDDKKWYLKTSLMCSRSNNIEQKYAESRSCF